MSEPSHTARRRQEYMPNRMFDPVANPFAVQNLLVKEEQVFTLANDERPEFRFETDPLVSKEGPGAFALDEVIELADLTSGNAFASESGDENAFVAAQTSVTEDAAMAMQETGFTADADITAQGAAEFTESVGQDEAIATDASDAVLMDAATHAETETETATAASPEIIEDDAAVAEEVLAASAGAQASEVTTAVTAAELSSEPEAVHPESVAADTDTIPAASAEPDLSSEAVTALVEAAREQARAEAHELAYNEGLEAGKAQAKAELQKEHDSQITQLKALQEALKKISFDPDALFEPVKKLTVHLAEQLVRGELVQTPQTISRLVDNCLRELNASGEKAVIVHLNPEDLDAYRPLVAQFGEGMILRHDALLERGSVRVSLDGSVVEDLMQRRVDGLKKSMNQPAAPSWQGGARLSDRLNESQRGSQHIEDVTAEEITGNDHVIDD